MRANVTQHLVSTMNYLYKGVFETLPTCNEPFSPFKLLRANEFVTQRLYEMILKANEAYNIETEEVGRFVEERTNAFERVKSIISER